MFFKVKFPLNPVVTPILGIPPKLVVKVMFWSIPWIPAMFFEIVTAEFVILLSFICMVVSAPAAV